MKQVVIFDYSERAAAEEEALEHVEKALPESQGWTFEELSARACLIRRL
jgi:hypothetical protein